MAKIKSDYIEQIYKYIDINKHSFHMPGHKNNKSLKKSMPDFLYNILEFDFTENDILDDLNHPKSIIKDYEIKASRLYNTFASFFLTNGSTTGILTAINLTVPPNGEIIIAKNSHKSVYNALRIANRVIHTIEQDYNMRSIEPHAVERACRLHPNAKAICITSPTYEGIISDIRSIASIAHKYNMYLIVDEAHGAYLPFANEDRSAINNGADFTIHSLHKTMPAINSCAMLHVSTNVFDEDVIREQIGVFQTSSPSYILIANMLWLMDYLENDTKVIKSYWKKIKKFRTKLNNKHNNVIFEPETEKDIFDYDYGKLLLDSNRIKISPTNIVRLFRSLAGIECEGIFGQYVLLYTSPWNSKNNYKTLEKTLETIIDKYSNASVFTDNNISYPSIKMDIAPRDIYAYPPGVPIVTKGEMITSKHIEEINRLINSGARIEGL